MNNEHLNPTQDPQPTRRRYTRALSLGSSLGSANSSDRRSNVLGIHFSPQVDDDIPTEVAQSNPQKRSGSPIKGPRPPPSASSAAGLRDSKDLDGQSLNNSRSNSPSKTVRIISPQSEALLSFHEQNPNKHQEHVQKRNEFEKAEAIVMERGESHNSEASNDLDLVNRKLQRMGIYKHSNSSSGTPHLEHSPKNALRVTNPSASTTSLDTTVQKNLQQEKKDEELIDKADEDSEGKEENKNAQVEHVHQQEHVKSDNKSEYSHKSRKSEFSNKSDHTHKTEHSQKSHTTDQSGLPPRTSSKVAVDESEQAPERVGKGPTDRDQIPVRKRSQTMPHNPHNQPQASVMSISQTIQPEIKEKQPEKFKRSVSAQQAVMSPSRKNTSSTISPENASMLKYAHLDFLSKPPSSTEFPYAPKVNVRSGSNFSLNASSIGSNGVDIRSSRGMKGLAHAEKGGGAVKFDLQKGGFVTPSNSSCSTTTGAVDPPASARLDAAPVSNKVAQHSKKIQKARSQGDLLRQTTLLNTSTSPARTARELRAVLSGSKFSSSSHQINLEQSRTRSRAVVDLVLDSEAVVEGGVLGGRMDVKLANDKVWWGNGKVRVVGFEDLHADETRHVFFHHDAPVDFYPPPGYGLPDDEGYYRGVSTKRGRSKENRLSLPFKIKLPIGGGAKGPLKSKPGFIRYIVIGSIHLKNSTSSDRSIAHFYRYVTIYPLLSPSSVLAPAPVPIMQTASKPLFLGGKGPINLTASVHRPHWVAGQRCYVMITIDNNSSKRIKSVSLSLNRTIVAYKPRPYASLMVGDDLDACQTTTNTKRIAEEKLEIGSKGTSGHVTAKGWFRGVDSGEQLEFSSSLQVPSDALTIPRTRLLEVHYTLRVGVAGSLSKGDVSVELPVRFINFLSIDPPPSAHPPTPMPMTTTSNMTPTDAELIKSAALERHKQDIERVKSPSDDVKTVDALRNTAKISPPALHAQPSVKAQTGNTIFSEAGPRISQMDVIDEALFNASVSRRGKTGKPPSPLPLDEIDTTAEQDQSSNTHEDTTESSNIHEDTIESSNVHEDTSAIEDSTVVETTQEMTEDSHTDADALAEVDDSGSEISFDDQNDISEPAVKAQDAEDKEEMSRPTSRPSSRPSLAESRRETLLNAIKDDHEESDIASIDQNPADSNDGHDEVVEETPRLDIHSPGGDFHDARDFEMGEEDYNDKVDAEAAEILPNTNRQEPLREEGPQLEETEQVAHLAEREAEADHESELNPDYSHSSEAENNDAAEDLPVPVPEEEDPYLVEEQEEDEDHLHNLHSVGIPQMAQDPLDRSQTQSRASHLSGGDVLASLAYLNSPVNDVDSERESTVQQNGRRPLPVSPGSNKGKLSAHEQVNGSPSGRSAQPSPVGRIQDGQAKRKSEDPFSPTFMEQHEEKELPLSPSNKVANSPSFWSPASKAAAAMPQLHPMRTDEMSKQHIEEEVELETPTKILNTSQNEYSFDTFKRYAAANSLPSPSAESDKSQQISVKGRVAQFEQNGGSSNRSSANLEPSNLIKEKAVKRQLSALSKRSSESLRPQSQNGENFAGASMDIFDRWNENNQLIRKEAMQDGEVAGRIGLTVKDSSKLIAKLIADKLVFQRNEYQPPNPRPLLKTYYYIDYQQFVDNVKWHTFLCDTCNAPLKDNDESDGVKGSQDMMARLLMQCRHIIAGLKLTEDMTLPPFDIADWISKNVKAITQPIKELEGEDDGLAVAGSGSNAANNKSQVRVQIVADEHDDEQKKKMEREEEERRTKNALPEWVLRSTISGEITAVGHRNQSIRDKSREEDVTQNQSDGQEKLNVDQYYNDYYSNYNTLKRSQSPYQETTNKRLKQDTGTTNVAQAHSSQHQPGDGDEDSEEDDDFEQVA
ncbi:hypothetical protein E3P86_00916 [Wallemia ichthyophaga]|uniref:Arrestin C-terminal-like domain-containing protein n=1 Tax=Wallemia ichthyophaga TaxID=245174 RepID=A0A4T0JBL9_WALIC|nr:hypothetical protein E3P86_00916 [Wallemia ichthyophaga]